MPSDSLLAVDVDSFSNIDLALFVACKTAYGGENDVRNLPAVLVEKGAGTAIRFTEDVNCIDANSWTEQFYTQLLNGLTVEEAIQEIRENYTVGSGLQSAVIYGDRNYRIVG